MMPMREATINMCHDNTFQQQQRACWQGERLRVVNSQILLRSLLRERYGDKCWCNEAEARVQHLFWLLLNELLQSLDLL